MKRAWSGKTQGGKWGQKFVLYYFKHGSLRLLYLVLYLVIPFYLIFDRKGYRATRWYAQKVGNKNRKWHLPFIFQIYKSFGQLFLDRFAMLGNPKRKFDFEIVNQELFDQFYHGEKGFLLVSAHVGNFELFGYFIKENLKTVHPILFGGEAEVYQRMRESLFMEHQIKPIILNPTGDYIFEIHNALQSGGIVSMPADRTYNEIKEFTVPFLGYNAKFPIGVYQIAATLEIPVLSIFVIKTGYKKFRVYIHQVSDEQFTGRKKEQVIQMGNTYVTQLEEVVKQHPTQWYNFFPFWDQQITDLICNGKEYGA